MLHACPVRTCLPCLIGAGALAALPANANLTAGDSVLVDFSAAGDAALFQVIRDDTPSEANLGIAQNAGLGTGAAPNGGLEAVNVGASNGGNDLAALYAPNGLGSGDGAITLAPGDAVEMSIKFKISDGTRAATPRFGLVSLADVSANTAGFTAFDFNLGKDTIGGGSNLASNHTDGIGINLNGVNNVDKAFSTVTTYQGVERVLSNDINGPYDLSGSNGSWYQFVTHITKSNTTDEFNISGVLNLLDANGEAVASRVGSVTGVVTHAGLYTDGDLAAGLTIVHNGAIATLTNEYDDFALAVETATTADLDDDGDVDDADFGLAFASFTGPVGETGGQTVFDGDLDYDGDVDDADFGLAFAAFTGPGAPANVPEPASLALLGLGGVLIHRRRRL